MKLDEEKLAPEVRDFLNTYIDSVANLEALLLFKRNPDREWSAKTLSDELRTNVLWSSKQIAWLYSKSFISFGSKEDFYKYSAENPEMDEVIQKVSDSYARTRLTMISFICDRLVRVQQFAEAFRIRKDDD